MRGLLAVFIGLTSSAAVPAFATCEAGQWTTLTTKVDFVREENGKVLKVEMPAGSEVHIVLMNEEIIGLYASTEFQGQQLSFTTGGNAADVLKVLRCSAAR